MIKNDSQPQWQQPKWEWLFPVIIFLILLFLILIIIPLDSLKVSVCLEGDCENGKGTYTWTDGDEYIGEWKDGVPHGQGTHTWPSGNKYIGQWKDGKKHGQGTFTWTSGNKYVGAFRDDKLEPQGTFTWASGGEYVGEIKDGVPHGQGIRTSDASGRNVKYVGRFEDGLPIETKDWVFVGTDQNHLLGQNHEWYILDESIEKKGDYTYILDLDSFSKFSVTSYSQIDCKTSRVRPKEFTFYDEPMAQGDFESGSDLPPDWIDIDVTPKASIFKALCKTELI